MRVLYHVRYDLLIRNGTLVRDDRVERADLAVSDEKIVEIAPEIAGDAHEAIDATGLHVFPGVIDPHVHFNEPGRTEWEGFATGSAALAAGGGTLFFDMPLNSSPPVLDGESFDLKLEAAKRSSLTDFALWGGLTPKNLDRMEELAERGVVGFKAFMCDSGIEEFPYADLETLRRGMQRAAKLALPVAVHAEDPQLTARLTREAISQSRCSPADYIATRPIQAEVNAVALAVALAVATGCSLHVVHASSENAVGRCRIGTRLGSITCETCPHYLCFIDKELANIGAGLKCAPPLRPYLSVRALQACLGDGSIAFVASDHSPAPPSMKTGDDFFKVWGGVAGVQSTLPAMLTLKPLLEPHVVARLTACAAAARFGLTPNKGLIHPGYDADVALVDLGYTFELRRDDLLDRHKLSPYVGRTFRGVIRRTILRGRTIFMDGKTVGPPSGRFVRPIR